MPVKSILNSWSSRKMLRLTKINTRKISNTNKIISICNKRNSSRIYNKYGNTYHFSKQQNIQNNLSIKNYSSSVIPDKLEDINSDELIINKTSQPGKMAELKDLLFGKTFTDHMLEVDWNNSTGWSRPLIKPYGPLLIDPAASALHYALEAFEGMKAYIDKDNNIRLFRPKKNMERLLKSCEALFFPQFDGDEFLKCLYELLKLERNWIPKKEGFSLYIRPTIIGTHPFIGVAPSEQVKLYCILSPVGPYYPRGFEPVNLYADQNHIRAWPKGVGCYKLGCNYGPTIKSQMKALAKNYDQVLWLYNDNVTEVGTMNLFCFWENKNGEKELITAPLDGTILPGVTRDSILTLARDWNQFKVTEKVFTMTDIVEAYNENRIIEMFGSGTAAIVCPVKGIGYDNKHFDIPLGKENKNEQEAGPLTRKFYKTLTDIQYGITPHPWSVIVDKSDSKKI